MENINKKLYPNPIYKEVEDTKNLIKLLDKIARRIKPNDKNNIEIYIRDLSRRAIFTDLKKLSSIA